jgi:hypothetical protein
VAANILVTFTADSDSLDASVKQATKDIAVIGDKAAQAGAKASEAFKDAGKSAAAAFSSGQVKAAIDSQVKSIDSLKAGVKKLYDEEIKLLSAGQKQSAAFKKNQEDAAKLRAEIDKLSKGTTVYGNETGKVEKAAVSLKTQLKNLKAELSNLEAQGQENSKAFQDTAFQAARLEDQIGDTNERVRVLASDTFKFDAAVGAIKGLAAGFSVVQGAAALFGEESEDLQKALLRVQAATALLTGIQEVANLVTGQGATKIAILSATQSAYAAVVGTSTGALKVFRLALAATGVGLLVIGLIELVQNFDKVKKVISNAVPGFEAIADGIGLVVDKTKQLLGIDSGGEKAKQALDGLIGVEKRKTEFQVQAIDRRISLLDAENKDTFELEIEKERIQIESLKRQAKAIKDGTDQLVKLDIDEKKQIRENFFAINAEILDRETAIRVLRIKNRRDTVVEIEKLERKGLLSLVEIKKGELKLSETIYQSEQEREAKRISGKIAVLELERSLGDDSLENTIAILKAKAEAEKNALGLTSEDSTKRQKIEADTQTAITKATEAETQKRIDLAFQYVDAIASAFSSINDLSRQLSENRIADITATSEVELQAINDSTNTERQKERERSALAKRTAMAIAAEKTKVAKQDKAIALFDIALTTAKAAFAAAVGPPPNPILAGIIIAAGAIQLAAVAAKPIPKFERGGVIGGQRHSQGGTMIEAERDEYIVNRGQSVKHRQELNAMNTSSAAFKKLIDERYVRPAVMSYMMQDKRRSDGVTVNAKLDSRSMESELRGLRKDIRKSGRKGINNSIDTRYSWQ